MLILDQEIWFECMKHLSQMQVIFMPCIKQIHTANYKHIGKNRPKIE